MTSKIKITIPAYVKHPDVKGRVFDKKAIKRAIKEFKDLPIIDRGCSNIVDGIDNYTIPNITTVGVAKKAKYNRKNDTIEIDGWLLNADLSYTYNEETKEIEFTEFSILKSSTNSKE